MGFKRKDTLESPLRRQIEAQKMQVEQNKHQMHESDY